VNPTSHRWLTAAALVALTLALLATALVALPQPAQAAVMYSNVEQLGVSSFEDAGLAVSQRSFTPEETAAVVLATQDNFPDGLTASAVAGAAGGPVLFTGRDALGPETAAEIDRLLDDGETVFVMGGAEAIDPAVTAPLEQTYEVVRIEGPTRLETAVAAAGVVGLGERVLIARAFGPGGAGTEGDRSTGWVDAISCGAYAAAQGIPILLTQTEVLSTATRDALAGSAATTATVCGGDAAVSEAVVDELEALGLVVDRVQGVTRVETAVDVARRLFGFSTARGQSYAVVPGYGERFGYGLAVAPLGLPILLVGDTEPTACADQSQPSRTTICYLQSGPGGQVAELLVVGDESLITDPVVEALGEAGGGADISDLDVLPAPTGVDVTDDVDDDGSALTVTWDAVADPDDILDGYTVYVDGEPVGEDEPTVDADTTEYELTGLTAGEEVSVTITAVDVSGRESEPSEAVTATPEDEEPEAITNFDADSRDNAVALSWNRGPDDAASYQLSRATATGGTCGTYADLATVSNPDTTTYTDSTAVNGTTYCYRITVTDRAGQTSPPATSDQVTPQAGPPDVEIQYPVGDQSDAPGYQGDTVRYGAPLTIEYTVTDSDNAAGDLRITLEMSYGGGAAGTYETLVNDQPIQFVTAGEDGPARLAVPSCAPGDTTSTRCIRDVNSSELAFRLTVEDPGGLADRDSSGSVMLVRNPPAVTGFAATAAQGQVNLVWDRVNAVAGLPIKYRVSRARVTVPPDSDASDESCPDPATPNAYTFLKEVEQPATSPVTTTDSTVDSDGEVLGGQQISDYLYCYLVQVERTPELRSPSVLSSANPLVAPGIGVAIQTPGNGGKLDRGDAEPIRYQLTIPQGATVTSVTLAYCLDYRRPNPLADPGCQDANGFKVIPANQLSPADPPRNAGSNTVTWTVPADATTSQGDGETGALQITAAASNASPGQARVTGIIFS
jgi:putative cell wall-binding protein